MFVCFRFLHKKSAPGLISFRKTLLSDCWTSDFENFANSSTNLNNQDLIKNNKILQLLKDVITTLSYSHKPPYPVPVNSNIMSINDSIILEISLTNQNQLI